MLWMNLDPEKLTARALAAVQERQNELLISAASAWEIATKVRSGKLSEAESFEREFLLLPERTGCEFLPVLVEDALRAGRMAGTHRDPFDRMIAAQAIRLNIPVVSSDRELDSFGVQRIW